MKKRLLWIALVLFISSLAWGMSWMDAPKVARGKSATLPLTDEMTPEQQLAQELALKDARVLAYTTGQRTEAFGVQTVSYQFNPATLECNDGERQVCRQVNIFNFEESATIAVMVNVESGKVLDVQYQPGIRPAINKRLADLALELAVNAPEVIEVLGHQPDSSSWAPMDSTLLGSACGHGHVCVAPTFELEGYILWAIVDLTDERFVDLFWTAGIAGEESGSVPYPDAYHQELPEGCDATPGSLTRDGWELSWETTAHDGFHVYNVSYNGQEVLTSAKLVEWHADYGSSGFQDSVGCTGGGGGFTLFPYSDSQEIDLLDGEDNVIGFEVVQDFRQPNWGANCNYRYEQHFQFFTDGRYRVVAGSYGRGCGANTIYRPLMRLDIAVDGDENDNLEGWDGKEWQAETTEVRFEPTNETSPEGYAWRIKDKNGSAYYIEPGRAQFNDAGQGDNEFIYALQFKTGEGDGDLSIMDAGCCTDDNHGPEIYLDEQSIENQNIVLWYVPQHHTVGTAPDYYCWTVQGEPNPESYPCFGGPLFVPTSSEPAPTPTPTPTATVQNITFFLPMISR